MHDLLARDARLVREERRVADEHLEEDAANGPPVDSLIVAVLSEHLRSNIIGGANS